MFAEGALEGGQGVEAALQRDVVQCVFVLVGKQGDALLEYPLLIEELDVLDDFMEEFDSDVELIWGQYEDDTLGAKAKFAIIATGVENAMPEDRHETAQLDEYIHRLYRSRKPLSPKEPDKGKPDEEKLSLPENDRSEDETPPVSQESVANKIRNKWMKRFEQWADWVYKD